MAGIIGIYGLVVSVLISDGLKQELPLYTGFIQLGAGLSVGLAGLAAGYVILDTLLLLPRYTQTRVQLLIELQPSDSQSASSATPVSAAQPNNLVSSSA